MTAVPYDIIWVTSYRMRDPRWFHDAAMIEDLVELLAATAWWPRLEVMGASTAGTPIGDRAEVKRRLLGTRGYWVLAQGGPRTTIYLDESEAWIKLDISPGYLGLSAGASDSALAEMKARVIDDFLDLLCALRRRWGDRAELGDATCTPGGDFSYPAPTPPRIANRPLHAVVDVLDVAVSQYGEAIAAATPPPGCQRLERDGLLILRMVTDPCDQQAVQQAAAAHEAWIGPVIDAPIDEDWEPET